MGISGQAKCSYQTEQLPFDLVIFCLEQIASRTQQQAHGECTTTTQRRRMKLGIDANLLGYKFVFKKSPFEPDGAVTHVASALSERLIDTVIITDGVKRHPSKRASCKRMADSEKQSIKLTIARTQLQSLLSNQDLVATPAERAREIDSVQKKIRKLENSLKQCLPSDFIQRLQQFVTEHDCNGKGEITMQVAPTQADPCLAKMAIDGSIDAIISGDSDFSMYVGPNGKGPLSDVMVKDLKLTMNKQPIKSAKLYTGQKSVADAIEEILQPKIGRSPFDKGRVPAYPIYSGLDDPMTRALIAIFMGCDACPGGVEGKGPKAAAQLLSCCGDLSGNELHNKLAHEISTAAGARIRDAEAVLCLARSLLFEKTNNGYIHGKEPSVLEKYLEEFACEGTQIVDGPSMKQCRGCINEPHSFLEAEGIFCCSRCSHILCRFCIIREQEIEEFDGDRLMCFSCMRDTISGMSRGEDEADMRSYLASKGQNIPAMATYLEVLELFKKAEAGEFDFFDEDIKNVKFPVLPTSALHRSQHVIARIKEVPLHEIGKIICDFDVGIELVVELIHILASLTYVKGRMKGESLSYKHVLPLNVMEMAANARVHTGERLCKRGLRHALDSGTPDILKATLTLGKFEDRVCIILDHKVLASFKSINYSASAAISATDFLAASCNCKAGCHNHSPSNLGTDRIICTHSMTEPIQLSQCMFRGMAAHVLVQLRNRIRREQDNNNLSRNNIERLRDDITHLIKATGVVPPTFDADTTILDMLSMYASTTEKMRMSPGEPKARDLGLLRDKVTFGRPEAKAERVTKHATESTNDDSLDTIPNLPEGTAESEDYKRIVLAIDGLSLLFSEEKWKDISPPTQQESETVPIGFKLVRHRAKSENAMTDDYASQHRPRLEMANLWRAILSNDTTTHGWKKKTERKQQQGKKRQMETNADAEAFMPKKKISRLACCVENCKSNDCNAKLSRVPNFPPDLPAKPTIKKRMTHRIKCFKRREITDRLGLGRRCRKKDLRVCDKHGTEVVRGKTVKLEIADESGKIVKTMNLNIPPFKAPVQVGKRSFHTPAETTSNGNGTDREIIRHVLTISRQESNLSTPTRKALAREGIENNSTVSSTCSDTDKDNSNKEQVAWRMPQISVDDLTSDEVRRRTGFSDLKHLLAYAAVVYAGNLAEMATTVTKLTFLEEIVLAYEFSWGRTGIRIEDYAKDYDCSDKPLMKAIRFRLEKELECRKRWPMYALFEEDVKFRDPKWNRHFHAVHGHRVVMHDTTNIPLPVPSSGDLNRALHNQYYNMCCAKAGVATQLCGWIYGLPLVTGHSDDDRQIADTKILEQQKAFVELKDTSSTKPFLNIFDRGYHQIRETRQHGQLCCQPDSTNDDEGFGGDKVLRTGCVAVVRSGNERGIKRSKMSWFVKRGCSDQLWDIHLLCDVWEAFTFRVNFMYDRFL